jgi:hypothetical protein
LSPPQPGQEPAGPFGVGAVGVAESLGGCQKLLFCRYPPHGGHHRNHRHPRQHVAAEHEAEPYREAVKEP